MKLSDKNSLYKVVAGWSDEVLEAQYYSSVYDCLGSVADLMEERNYDVCDIKERRIYERYLSEKNDILEELCLMRGIELWQK